MAATTNGQHEPPFDKILIAGAGPSGLLLAILLAQRGIPSTILESWPHLDSRLRASQYGVPATRVFRRAGLLPDFREASIPKFPTICWRRVADHEKLIEIDMSVVEEEEDRMTVLPLGTIVQIMYKHVVERFGPEGTEGRELIKVLFNHKVVGTGQDSMHAWAEVEIGNADRGEEVRTERFSAPYLIGCDGGRSAVRKSLFGKSWPGQTWDCRFLVQNVYYEGFAKHGWDGGNYMIDPEHWGLIARRGYGGLWRVTYGDVVPGLTDEEYLERRPWHLKALLPGNPDPGEYKVEGTNLYNIHNRCVESFKQGRILLAADAAHACNPMGGYGCMTACLDVDGLADCFIGMYFGLADESILQTWADVRREIYLKYVDARSIKNLERVSKTDPWTVKDTDKFFGIIKELNEDPTKQKLKEFLLKVSSIEHDFKQYYHTKDKEESDGPHAKGNGHAEPASLGL